jgi:hypothetical protein
MPDKYELVSLRRRTLRKDRAMPSWLRFSPTRFYAILDWFIPPSIATDAPTLQRARMFLLSHLLGPFLGHTITGYLLIIGGVDQSLMVLDAAITVFWA